MSDIAAIDLGFQALPSAIMGFLIEGTSGYTVIEPGPGSCFPAWETALTQRGASLNDVRRVFTTHVHLDHAGAAGHFAQKGATIFCHPLAARHLLDPTRLWESSRMVYGDQMEPLWGSMIPVPPQQLVILEDGEHHGQHQERILAMETPGHARHHHAWEHQGILFAGDTAGVRKPGGKALTVTGAPPQFDAEAYETTLLKLAGHHFDRLALTHGGFHEDVRDHLDRYRDEVRVQTDFLSGLCQKGQPDSSIAKEYRDWLHDRILACGKDPEEVKWHDACNPVALNVMGICLYLRKKQEEAAGVSP
jgi:glyoxylase-like metal-dependent hydrolase (beta-lactamase superfamily II)